MTAGRSGFQFRNWSLLGRSVRESHSNLHWTLERVWAFPKLQPLLLNTQREGRFDRKTHLYRVRGKERKGNREEEEEAPLIIEPAHFGK